MVALEQYLTESPARQSRRTSSVAFSAEDPEWRPRFETKLKALRALSRGWDGADAKRVSAHVASYARSLVQSLGEIREPQVVPLISGGLQLEWHANFISIEVSIEQPHVAALFIEFQDSGEVIERRLDVDDAELRAALDAVSE